MTPHAFIRTYLPHARRYQELHGLPGCVALAQAALETGWGKRIAGGNLFGIKALPGEPAQELVTHEYVAGRRLVVTDRFRAFATPDEAFDALARVLMSPRYAPVRQVRHDPDAFCEALQQCGYATDPEYARKLRAIISRWRLAELLPPPGPARRGEPDALG